MKCEEVITAPADYNKELDTTTHWQLPLLCLAHHLMSLILACPRPRKNNDSLQEFIHPDFHFRVVFSSCCHHQCSIFSIIINKVRVIIELLSVLPPDHWGSLGIFKVGEQQESYHDDDHGEMLDWDWQNKYRRCMPGSFQLCQSMKISRPNDYADMIQDWKAGLLMFSWFLIVGDSVRCYHSPGFSVQR